MVEEYEKDKYDVIGSSYDDSYDDMWLNEDNGLKIAGMLSILVVNRY